MGQEGPSCSQTSRIRNCAEFTSNQGPQFLEITRLCQRTVCLEALLLYLTNEGISYLRSYLHLPPEIVPSTLKRQVRPDARARPSAGAGGGRSFGDKPSDDRASYRRAPGTNGDKAGAAGPGSAPMEFRGGFGRGKAE